MPNIARITPSRASGTDAKGIFPPILRAVTHIGFMMALLQAQQTEQRDTTNDELTAEIDHIINHWTLLIRPAYINPETLLALQTITNDISSLRESVTADERPVLIRNTQNLLASILSTAVALDTSVFGLRHPEDTDAGTQL